MPKYNNRELINALLKQDLTNYSTLRDLLGLLKLYEEEDKDNAVKIAQIVRDHAMTESTKWGSLEYFELYKAALLFRAPYLLDDYLLYLEIDREPKERFYLPRRKILKMVVDELQRLVDDELDALFVSMPPRVGKSQLGIMFLTWLIGRAPNRTNLVSGYSDKLTRSFYDGVLEIVEDPDTYNFYDVFPTCRLVNTNSKDETLDFGKRSRYSTLTCRSIEGSLTGNTEANNLLYADDLVEGIESALSPVRMNTLWDKVTNNLLSRRKKTCKLLFIGTRWSVNDPLGRLLNLFTTSKDYQGFRTKVISIPALNEHGESNFDYDYGVGFSTTDFLRIKAMMSDPDFKAQYQQTPLDREGRLFNVEEMNYYNGNLPEGDPDKVLMAVDVAYGGGDFLVGVVGLVYGQSVFIPEVVFSDQGIDVTVPKLEAVITRYAPNTTRFEANNGGFLLADKVSKGLSDKGINRLISSRTTPSSANKMTRIMIAAPNIVENFHFLAEEYQSAEYKAYFNQLTAFSTVGKNVHDDAPDATSMLNDLATEAPSVKILKRVF